MQVSSEDIICTSITDFDPKARFIKLPLLNYMTLLDQEPINPQIALVNAINNPKYRFIVAALSRRTGKTHISNIIGQLVTLIPNSDILIISPNYSLSSISWEIQKSLLKKFDIETERMNAKDKVIELQNSSTIRMGSIGQVDSVVGRSYNLIIFDEAALNEDGKDAFNTQLLPTLDKKDEYGNLISKAIFISTPRGKNWFYDFYNRGFSEEYPDWASIHATYKDNPRATDIEIASAKRSMSRAEFAQEYECNFVVQQGQIWELESEYIVDIDLSKIQVLDIIAGLDIGFKDATAFIVIATDGYHWYIIDEYVATQKTTAKHAEEIKKLIDDYNIDFIYIDSAAAQTKYDFAMQYDIGCMKSKKSKLDGIGYIASVVENGRVYVDRNCRHVIDMFENYRWDDRSGLLKEKEVHDSRRHPADAIRYAIYTHSFGMYSIIEESDIEPPNFKEENNVIL